MDTLQKGLSLLQIMVTFNWEWAIVSKDVERGRGTG